MLQQKQRAMAAPLHPAAAREVHTGSEDLASPEQGDLAWVCYEGHTDISI